MDVVLGSTTEGLVLDAPERLTDVTAWHGHIPFAFWCVEALRPRIFVELGTHLGDSYSAFCQAVQRLSLPTACFAVDTWAGDPQAGFYGEDVYREFRLYHDAHFGAFSRLIRSTFDDAVSSFADGSIDLLHVDGLHTYEAVKHDFETWFPKLSRSAVVLFHDIAVRERDFGVWRFWGEVRDRYPGFSFLHSHGLGVLVVGGEAPEAVRRLASSSREEMSRVRALFSRLGATVEEAAEQRRITTELASRIAPVGSGPEDVQAEAARHVQARRDQIAGSLAEIQRLKAHVEEVRTAAASAEQRHEAEVRRIAGELEQARTAAASAEQRHEAEVRRIAGELEQARTAAAEAEKRREEEVRRVAGELEQANADLSAIRGSSAFTAGRALASGVRPLQKLAHAGRVGLHALYWTATFQLRTGLRRRKYARLIRRSRLFQEDFYLAQLPDSSIARRDPIWHFLARGAAEGRDPNPLFDTSYYVEHCPESIAHGKNPLVHFIRNGWATGCDPGPRFDVRFYLDRYPDVRATGLNPLAHYLTCGAAEGRVAILPEVARRLEDDHSAAVPFRFTPDSRSPASSLAVMCHLFYTDVALELRRYLQNIPQPFDLFLTTDTPDKRATLEECFRDWAPGTVEVRLCENRGRDIAPKLVVLRDVYPRYDLVLHLHSKKSPHTSALSAWRGYLFETLLGSPAIVGSILEAFAREPRLGIVAAQHFEPIRHNINWGGNLDVVTQVATRIGVRVHEAHVLDFPSGSMFWARSSAFRPLLDLGLSIADFAPERGQMDGTLAHAFERLYYFSCEQAGYRWMKVARPEFCPDTPAIDVIESPGALRAFMTKSAVSLTGPDAPSPRTTRPPVIEKAAPALTRTLQARVLEIGTRATEPSPK